MIDNRSDGPTRNVRLPIILRPARNGVKSYTRWIGALNHPGQTLPETVTVSWYLLNPLTGNRVDSQEYSQVLTLAEILQTDEGWLYQDKGRELLVELVFNGKSFTPKLSIRKSLDPILIN